jgi:hypothetical protein
MRTEPPRSSSCGLPSSRIGSLLFAPFLFYFIFRLRCTCLPSLCSPHFSFLMRCGRPWTQIFSIHFHLYHTKRSRIILIVMEEYLNGHGLHRCTNPETPKPLVLSRFFFDLIHPSCSPILLMIPQLLTKADPPNQYVAHLPASERRRAGARQAWAVPE